MSLQKRVYTLPSILFVKQNMVEDVVLAFSHPTMEASYIKLRILTEK